MSAGLFSRRNEALDMFRGLTMLLMVFVNDLWSVGGVPHFLEHFEYHEDGMGVADIVFPMFLFAMGMSIPYAIERRFEKGFTGESTLAHILVRTLALLLMGVFIVNSEEGVSSIVGYGYDFYRILMVIAFFLVWNSYPSQFKFKRPLQAIGAAVLAFLAFTYRTPEGGFFTAGWWGILGLIGWAYCFCAVSYLLARKNPKTLFFLWISLLAVNMLLTDMRDGTRLIQGPSVIADMAGALRIGNAFTVIMAMGGVLLSLAERQTEGSPGKVRAGLAFAVSGCVVVFAVLTHRWWITSKLIGTLPMCLAVTAISVVLYTSLRILEFHGKIRWFRPLRSSGTATLTVYMLPYILYCLASVAGLHSPEWLYGAVGLLKCALFSLLCVFLAELLGKAGIRLKI